MRYRRRRSLLARIGLLFIIISLFGLAFILCTDIFTMIEQARLHDDWNNALNGQVKRPSESMAENLPSITRQEPSTVELSELQNGIPKGTLIARIVIPKIMVDAIVLEGTGLDVLKYGPGHMKNTAMPGEIGNVVISGHRITYSRPFYRLNELNYGDPIYLYTKSNMFIYHVVAKKVVAPSDMSVTLPTSDRTLTLTTCNPRFSARTRLIVIAKM